MFPQRRIQRHLNNQSPAKSTEEDTPRNPIGPVRPGGHRFQSLRSYGRDRTEASDTAVHRGVRQEKDDK